eukprot:g3413.t1
MSRIEEVASDDDMPQLEQVEQAENQQPNAAPKEEVKPKQNRAEKKSRKAMQKLGMKQVNGIVRCTIKKSKTILFVVTKPDVFKSPSSDTYVIFGEAKIEDLSAQAQSNAAQQFRAPTADVTRDASATEASTPAAEEEGEEVDESGVEARDIELVQQQANVTRAQAVKALKDNDGDIVNAIMDLSM